MNLLYDLPVALQQVILTEALNMHMHRAPQHKLLDDRQFYYLNFAKDLSPEMLSADFNNCLSIHHDCLYHCTSMLFMLYVVGLSSIPPPCSDSGL